MKRKRKSPEAEKASLSAVAARKLLRSNHSAVDPGINSNPISTLGNKSRFAKVDFSQSISDNAGSSRNGSLQGSKNEDEKRNSSSDDQSSYDSEDGMVVVEQSEEEEDVIHIEEDISEPEHKDNVDEDPVHLKIVPILSSFAETSETVQTDSRRRRSRFLFMKSGDYITILGHFDLKVHRGLINSYGATLQPSQSWHRFYSPSTHALCPFRCISDGGPALLRAEIEIRPFHCGIRAIEELSRSFASSWNREIDLLDIQQSTRIYSSSYIMLNSRTQHLIKQPLTALQMPVRWDMLLREYSEGHMESGSTTLVCGPKGAGKSTLAQLLVNTLLTLPHLRKDSDSTLAHVAFLDLDPGQPHFTPSGHISLSILHHPFWGPPYTHPGFPVDGKTRTTSKIIRSHFVAATTPKHDPRHFDDCIRDLMARYSQFSRTCDACPLVVNCPGWIQGPGFEFMKRTVRLIVPDHIVYMSQEGPQRVVDGIQRAAGRARIHILPSQESQNKARTALDLRTMQTMSYFHLSSHRSDHLLWTSDPVANHTSWDFEYTGRNRGVFGIMIADENCQATQLCGLLDGSLAGIVVLDDDSALDPDPEAEYIHLKIEGHPQADRDEQDQSGPSNGVGSNDQDVDEPLERLLRTTKESLPYIPGPLPSPSKSHCIGLGYVRNIDTRTQTMQIVTPISKSYIAHLQEEERKLILVLGRLDTPGWAYAEEAIKSHFWWRRRTRAGDSGSQPPSEETAGEKKRITELVQRSPWLKERSKKEKRPGEGPWKVRRNLVLR